MLTGPTKDNVFHFICFWWTESRSSIEIYVSANRGYVETFNFYVQSVLMVWLGSGTWLGLGKKGDVLA